MERTPPRPDAADRAPERLREAQVTGGYVRPAEERDGLWLVLAAAATALLVALL